MRKLHIAKCLRALAMLMLLLLSLPVAVFAAERTGSLTVNVNTDRYTPAPIPYRIYKVGQYVDGKYVLTGAYAGYNIDLTKTDAPEKLLTKILESGKQPYKSGTTSNGTYRFTDLPEGVYLLEGDRVKYNGKYYTPVPVLVAVPQNERGVETWDVTVSGKFEVVDTPTVDVQVTKKWVNDKETDRPAEITVELVQNGTRVVDTIKLDKTNNWRYSWHNLDADDTWSVREKTVPKNYKVSYSHERNAWIITNTHDNPPPPTTTPPSKLPQTGQLWWPVFVMSAAGVFCLAVGVIRRKGSGYEK